MFTSGKWHLIFKPSILHYIIYLKERRKKILTCKFLFHPHRNSGLAIKQHHFMHANKNPNYISINKTYNQFYDKRDWPRWNFNQLLSIFIHIYI